jgi:hypothetical protein
MTRVLHPLQSYVSELPGLSPWLGLAWFDLGVWMTNGAGEEMPLRPSVAHWRLTEPNIYWGPRGSEASSNMGFPSHDTSATHMCPNVNSIGGTWATMSNRSCAFGAVPELRSPDSVDIPELELELPCSEEGGETIIHSKVTTKFQMGQDIVSDRIQSEDTTPASEYLSSVTGDCRGRIARIEPRQ